MLLSNIVHNVCLCALTLCLLFLFSMITLKVLNSIVLLGKSCMYVKEANMEEKLFQNPPSAAPSRASSRAHRTKHTQEPSGTAQSESNLDNRVKFLFYVMNHKYYCIIGNKSSLFKCFVVMD